MKTLALITAFLLVKVLSYAQNVGIGTLTPMARLHVIDSSVVFSATGFPTYPVGNPPISGIGRRMMWYADKGAFRAGIVIGSQWDKDSVSNFSTAFGYNPVASGFISFSAGGATRASGETSTALGNSTTAAGFATIATGYSSYAAANYSMSLGEFVTSNSRGSISLGRHNDPIVAFPTTDWVLTEPLFILGNGTGISDKKNALVILKNGNVGIGLNNPTRPLTFPAATGLKISLFPGITGDYGFGVFTNELRIQTDYDGADITFGYDDFTLGFTERMRVKANGNVGIGTSVPMARLHVIDSSVVFSRTGYYNYPHGNPPISGNGRRMMWYADLAAFRAGYVVDTGWNASSVGYASIAMGSNPIASGLASVAIGSNTSAIGHFSLAAGFYSTAVGQHSTASGYYATASGYSSTALGHDTEATGWASTALGLSTTASGEYSTAMGNLANATANYSIAIGESVTANSWASITLGRHNDPIVTSPTSSWILTEPLFILGNGPEASDKKNALVVLKNGNVGIGLNNPTRPLTFPAATGLKISLYPGATGDYGFGVFANELRIQTDYNGADITFGYDDFTIGFTERMRVKANGNVGIGTNNPYAKLDINGNLRFTNVDCINGYCPTNEAIRLTPNLHLNATTDNAVIVNWDNGNTNSANFAFRIGNGNSQDVFWINYAGSGWMQGILTQASDARLKKDIQPLQHSLQKISQLNGYHYFWKNENADTSLQTGVLAQEVKELFPELVKEDHKGFLAVNYSGLIPVLIESIKEQQKQIDQQQDQIDHQQQQIDRLEKLVLGLTTSNNQKRAPAIK